MTSSGPPLAMVEDNPEDLDIFARIVRKAGIENPIWRFERGEDAILRLSNLAGDSHEAVEPLPLIVFLDLKTPDFGGLEILQWIRAHDAFARVSVIICSGSEDPNDWRRVGMEAAQAFVPKFPTPEEVRQLVACAQKFAAGELVAFDVRCNRLPPESGLPFHPADALAAMKVLSDHAFAAHQIGLPVYLSRPNDNIVSPVYFDLFPKNWDTNGHDQKTYVISNRPTRE
jgi:CheY-like chemotaxis protein